jgi:hypothetical protein
MLVVPGQYLTQFLNYVSDGKVISVIQLTRCREEIYSEVEV